MNTRLMSQIPWLAWGILWFAYTLLGWYLAAHHILWIVGAVLIAAMVATTGKGSMLIKHLLWLSSQSLFIILATSLIVSISAVLFVTDFQFLGLIFLPVVAMFWADLEMRSAEFKRHQILIWLAAIAGLGLTCGEAIDLLLIPSMRY